MLRSCEPKTWLSCCVTRTCICICITSRHAHTRTACALRVCSVDARQVRGRAGRTKVVRRGISSRVLAPMYLAYVHGVTEVGSRSGGSIHKGRREWRVRVCAETCSGRIVFIVQLLTCTRSAVRRRSRAAPSRQGPCRPPGGSGGVGQWGWRRLGAKGGCRVCNLGGEVGCR